MIIKFVYDSVGRYYPVSGRSQKTQYLSNCNCFHSVVRLSGGTYLVPRWRICYS